MVQILELIGTVLRNVISIYSILLVIYILMSWVPSSRENAFGQFLGKIVDPYLAIFRKIIPPLGMIDISPIVAIITLKYVGLGIEQVILRIINVLT